jgi:parallel beta-helix repeat protein
MKNTRTSKNTRTLILFGIVAMAAGMAQAGTPITTCGYQITAPGDYEVTNDLISCSTNYGIDIEASHVVVHVNGHVISSIPGNSGSHGFLINNNGTANPLTAIQIVGSGLIEGWQEGIDTFNTISKFLVQDLTIASNSDRGLNLRTSSQVTFSLNVVARNSGAGVYIDAGSTQVNVENNEFTANGQGIYVHGNSNGNQFSLNVVAGNLGDGVVVDGSSNNNVQLNSTVGNATSGIHVLAGATGNTIHANTSSSNGSTSGYDMQDDNSACGSDLWYLDTFFTSNQSCIK